MSLEQMKGRDADGKEAKFGAWLDAETRSLQAIIDFPDFKSQRHIDEVNDFKTLVEIHTGFNLVERKKYNREAPSPMVPNTAQLDCHPILTTKMPARAGKSTFPTSPKKFRVLIAVPAFSDG